MRLVRPVYLLLLLLLIATAGCTAAPATPAAAAEVAFAFMTVRATGNAERLYGMLTAEAQVSMDREMLSRFLRAEQISFDSIGAPMARDEGWVQAPVRGLAIRSEDREIRWSEYLLTLRYDGRRWRVAWIDPLLAQALLAYGRSSNVGELELGRQITGIDPYHYRGHLESHFALRGLKRYREAEYELVRAQQLASPVQLPDVLDATARFKLALDLPAEAATSARSALDLARPFAPSTYSAQWQADTLVVLARALWAAGDRPAMEEALSRAAALDPENGPLAVLRMDLTSVTPAPSP